MNRRTVFFGLWLLCARLGYAGQGHDFLVRQVQPALFSISRIMMHDVVSPPVASRYYFYCTLGAYSIVARYDDAFPHPSKWLRELDPMIGFLQGTTHADADLAALFCIYESALLFLPSGNDLQAGYEAVQRACASNGFTESDIKLAKDHARRTAQSVWNFSKGDGYRFLSTYSRYRPKRRPGYWFPTPPAYMDAVDPHWGTMRTAIIDSAGQFLCAPPVPFDSVPGSAFHALMQEVYEVKNRLTDEQKDIAAFWDCNPFVVSTAGHMSLGFKKISPGGHWMNITCIAAAQRNLSFRPFIQLVALEATTLYDAFIVCWKEKYRSDRIRPESVINKYVEVSWQPLLQTPPFPEYTSGHSVASTASAELLSYLLGDTLSYTDDTEIMFDLPPRRYTGFRQAAAEASVSRLYGGIHFRDAIENGQEQGRKVGAFIVARLKSEGINPYE